jgi:hypothetical protein
LSGSLTAARLFVSQLSPYFDLEEDDDPQQIILGSAFLRKYYSIYDYDSKVVGCKSSCSSLITLVDGK